MSVASSGVDAILEAAQSLIVEDDSDDDDLFEPPSPVDVDNGADAIARRTRARHPLTHATLTSLELPLSPSLDPSLSALALPDGNNDMSGIDGADEPTDYDQFIAALSADNMSAVDLADDDDEFTLDVTDALSDSDDDADTTRISQREVDELKLDCQQWQHDAANINAIASYYNDAPAEDLQQAAGRRRRR